MTSNSEIKFYYDTLIVETILSNDNFHKKADGLVSSITDNVKNYVSNHIDPNDKSGSLLNILAPGAISVMFSAMGLGKIGLLFSLAASVFHIDVKGILQSIYDGVKSLISGGGKVSSSQVDGIVQSAMQSHVSPDEEGPSQIQTASIQQDLKDAKMIKLSLISYDKQIRSLNKQDKLISYSISRKGKITSILGRIISWVFKISLASAGFMVAGDAVNKLLDRPNAFDGTMKDGKPTETAAPPAIVSKQTKFPLKSGFVDTRYNFSGNNWIEKINNSKNSIENMLVSFAKEVYDGLDGQDAAIKNSTAFRDIVEDITWYNHSAVGDPIVFIPKKFTSKKQLVDFFIDQVAGISAPNINPNNIKLNIDEGQRFA